MSLSNGRENEGFFPLCTSDQGRCQSGVAPGKLFQPLGDSSSYRRQRPPRERPAPALPLGQAGPPLPSPLHVPCAPAAPFLSLLLERALRCSPQTLSGVDRRVRAARVVAVPQEGTALWQVGTYGRTHLHLQALAGVSSVESGHIFTWQ